MEHPPLMKRREHIHRHLERYNKLSSRVPHGCLMPVRAILLTVVLLIGVLPLYFHTLRRAKRENSAYQVVCGLYPDTLVGRSPSGSDSAKGGSLTEVAWQAMVSPPAPPGAGDISDPEQCRQDFRVFFDDYVDYGISSPYENATFIAFSVTIEDLDAEQRYASARVLAYPSSSLAGELGTIRLPPGVVLGVSVNGEDAQEYQDGDAFISGSPMKIRDIPVEGKPDLSLYPFDRYTFALYVALKFINTTKGNTTSFVPFVASMNTRNPTFQFTTPPNLVQKLLHSSMSGFGFSVVVTRTQFTKAFSIFIFVAMWILTLFAVVHAVDLVFVRKHREIGFDAPAYTATLLFALPAVRQVQPGVPDVGAVIDVVGFFWNMVLLAVVCCLYVTLIYAQHVRGANERHREQQELQEQEEVDEGGVFVEGAGSSRAQVVPSGKPLDDMA